MNIPARSGALMDTNKVESTMGLMKRFESAGTVVCTEPESLVSATLSVDDFSMW